MGKLDIRSAERVVTAFRNDRALVLSNAQLFLQHPELKSTLKEYRDRQEAALEKATTVLGLFRKQGLNRYNIFRKIGFVANEDYYSDAVASILNPHETHGLGTRPLRNFLNHLHKEWCGSAYSSRIRNIAKSLEHKDQCISVYREKRELYTRPDITIIGSDFAIFIENKIRGGTETDHRNGEKQTVRQGDALGRLADRLKIQRDHILGIFLSPEGKRAKNNEFVPVSVGELIAVLRQTVKRDVNGMSYNSIHAFLDFYSFE